MFVVQRKSAPEYQLIVQNRLANNTFVEPVGGPQYEVQEKAPFLLIQNPMGEIHGLWFYEGGERANVLQVLQGLAARASSMPSQVPTGHPPSAQPAPDIMALLQGHTQQQTQQTQQHGQPQPHAQSHAPHGAKAVSVSQLFAAAAMGSSSPAPAAPAQPSSPHPQDLPQPSRMMAPGGMAQPMAQTVLAAGGPRIGSKHELAEQLRRLADSAAFVDLVWNEYQKL